MYINKIQCQWKQEAGSGISGPVWNYYNLFFFLDPVDVEEDGRIIRTRPNACIFTEPKHKRKFDFFQNTEACWLHADQSIGELLQEYEIPLNRVFYPEDPGLIAELFRKLRMEFISRRFHRERMLDAIIKVLVVALSRMESKTPEIRNRHHQDLVALRTEIFSCPEKSWTVTEMAQRVNMSPSRFHAVYKTTFGISPMQDAIQGKIDCAKSMLITRKNSNLTLIAERLGYSNLYHFIRQFKEFTGMTPGAYRKKNR